MKTKNNFWIQRINLLAGIASLANIFGDCDLRNDLPLEEDADLLAIANDWKVIGNDMKTVLRSEIYKPQMHQYL
jgi:hypothetical protein